MLTALIAILVLTLIGTLTLNHMTVTKLWYFGEVEPIDVTNREGQESLNQAIRRILRIGNIVNNARLQASDVNSVSSASLLSTSITEDVTCQKSRWIGQPTDVALLDLLDIFGEDDVRERLGERYDETPFSSERKWMGSIVKGKSDAESRQNVAYIKGALEQVLSRCDTYVTADGQEIVLDNFRRQEILQAARRMETDGLRVLGFASGMKTESGDQRCIADGINNYTSGEAESISEPNLVAESHNLYKGLTFSGLAGMYDPPRKGLSTSIAKLIASGIKVIMITGDSATTALAIGKKIGMPLNLRLSSNSPVLLGSELEKMTELQLANVIGTKTIFARTSPEQKYKIVEALQACNSIVAMTGDGVNDAPALKKADIGIAMGKLGTDVAKEASDMIIMDDNFSTILDAIEEGKAIFYNIQNFLTFQLSTSVAALALVLLSTFLGLQNPLNAMQILWISEFIPGCMILIR